MATNTEKLSILDKQVLARLVAGEVLTHYGYMGWFRPKAYTVIGKPGEMHSDTVRAPTFDKLCRLKYIRQVSNPIGASSVDYGLTDTGRAKATPL
jgi:hypothetical protein